jgi:hypothetical protein
MCHSCIACGVTIVQDTSKGDAEGVMRRNHETNNQHDCGLDTTNALTQYIAHYTLDHVVSPIPLCRNPGCTRMLVFLCHQAAQYLPVDS